jgi:rod shape-determining protein MreD
MTDIPKIILRFILLVILQVFILDNIGINGYVNPYVYVLFILLLPMETPNWLLLILGFITGFTIDVFTQTLGMHLSATIFLAYCRPLALKLLSPRGGYDFGLNPNLQQMGINWFVTYAAMLIFAHHLFLFFVESLTFAGFFSTLFRSVLSSIFSLIIVVIFQLLSYNNKKIKI